MTMDTVTPLSEFPKEGRDSHFRLCYHRAGRDWRVRDERTGELWLVKDYEGTLNANWLDGGSHIFHTGMVKIDSEGVAHFSE